jgi:aminopeptidase N
MDEVTVTEFMNERPPYQAARTQMIDIKHTILDLRFDWDQEEVLGKATLRVSPYFFTTQIIELDAVGMEILSVQRKVSGVWTPMLYEYDGAFLAIDLARPFKRTEEFELIIEYIARPAAASTNSYDQGLYFVDPRGEDPHKPTQIWTQGQTQANSHWFPTFDSPNERMTTEIFLHVDSNFTTISNGVLDFSIHEEDGMRLDAWRMSQPHPPYLVMIGIGEFAMVEDNWREIDVAYYVEESQEEYAPILFGETPNMLSFFSEKLGVDYPWESFRQMVARDYFSGAMENTTAVIHGEFVYGDERELVDHPQEDLIAHEMFHHWFGDYVTCESWSNLPLNESFATYGEYLWREHKNGRDDADAYLDGDLRRYLMESRSGWNKDLIRFDYGSEGEMFDSHSYAKGGRVLHMLRYYVGEEAFFDGLQKYLEDNALGSVEIHHLRMSFEELTGEDLNWFFNQWFLDKGHPELDISYNWVDSTKQMEVTVKQTQDTEELPLYKLPVVLEAHMPNTSYKYYISVEKKEETFLFDIPEKPLVMNFDAEKVLLCEKKDHHTDAEWMALYKRGRRFMDRWEAFEVLSVTEDSLWRVPFLIAALHDQNYRIQKAALKFVDQFDGPLRTEVEELVLSYAHEHSHPQVREAALYALYKEFEYANIDFYMLKLDDPSYKVAAAALEIIHELDTLISADQIIRFRDQSGGALQEKVAELWAEKGRPEDINYMMELLASSYSNEKTTYLRIYSSYLRNTTDEIMVDGCEPMFLMAAGDPSPWTRYSAVHQLQSMVTVMKERSKKADGYYLEQWEGAIAQFEQRIKDIKEAETSAYLRKRYGLE